jgi:hypothetical protein
MNKLNSSFVQSVVCTAVAATIIGLIVACGGGRSLRTITNPIGSTAGSVVRLVNHTKPIMVTVPAALSATQPFMATFFQTPQAPQLQQSFDGQGPCLQVAMPSSGYIPIWLYMENGIGGPFGKGSLACQGVFSKIGGGVDQISGQTLVNPGLPMFLGGTLTTLVATGVTVNGKQIRCSDLTTAVSVNDGDMVQPYFVIATNSVILGIGTKQLSFESSGSPAQFRETSEKRRCTTVTARAKELASWDRSSVFQA